MDYPDGTKPDRKRMRKAALALLAFQKKLSSACGRFSSTNQWYTYVKEKLEPILQTYERDLPAPVVRKIREATNLIDTTSKGMQKTCKTLSGELAKVVKTYAGTSPVGNLVNGLFIAGAVLAGVSVVYLTGHTTTVVIKNRGCQPINPVVSAPLSLPGLSLPSQPIPNGAEAVAKVPALSFTVDGSTRNLVRVTALGISMTFQLESSGIDLTLDGKSLLGTQTTIDLARAPSHELVVRCR